GNGCGQRQRARAREDEDSEDFLGGVRDGGKRIRGEDRQARDPRESLVMREMGRNGVADDEPLDLRENAFFGHGSGPDEAARGSPESAKATARAGVRGSQTLVRFR